MSKSVIEKRDLETGRFRLTWVLLRCLSNVRTSVLSLSSVTPFSHILARDPPSLCKRRARMRPKKERYQSAFESMNERGNINPWNVTQLQLRGIQNETVWRGASLVYYPNRHLFREFHKQRGSCAHVYTSLFSSLFSIQDQRFEKRAEPIT